MTSPNTKSAKYSGLSNFVEGAFERALGLSSSMRSLRPRGDTSKNSSGGIKTGGFHIVLSLTLSASVVIGIPTLPLFEPFSRSSIALADSSGAFKWTDSNGRVHFGSHPPKGANNVVSLSGRKFSHYSSSKMMRPYRNILSSIPKQGESEFDPPAEAETSTKDSLNRRTDNTRTEINPSSLSMSKSRSSDLAREKSAAKDTTSRASLKRRAIEEENIVGDTSTPPAEDLPTAPELTQGAVTIKLDQRKRITECRVGVQNTSNIPAQGVIVSFEFSDGTLIPGVGPDSLAPGEEGTYLVPDELLPVVIKNVENDSEPPKPQVTIKAGD